MAEKSSPRPVLGYTDVETVKLDFDNTCYCFARDHHLRIMKMFRLRGLAMLRSSENHYHTVFNRTVSWSENVKIMAWAALLTHMIGQLRYLQMQCIKMSSTLRVSSKGEKPSPRIVYRFGVQDGEIDSFLKYRRKIKAMIGKIGKAKDA